MQLSTSERHFFLNKTLARLNAEKAAHEKAVASAPKPKRRYKKRA
jgi:hypothetical protein